MGMAASQARYLSLVARKTNTEYEGQQLNQQRLNLSNQTADLFNQMLTMSVPTCPDSNDYTTLQYSWSDGNNTYVLSDYYQLGTTDENYNYVVTSYYETEVYTGSLKTLADPQVQATRTNVFTRNADRDYTVTALTYKSETVSGAGDDYYYLTISRNGVESTTKFVRSDQNSDTETVDEIDEIFNRTATTDASTSYTVDASNSSSGYDEIIIAGDVTIANPDYDPEEEESDSNPRTITISASDTTDNDGNTVSGVTFIAIDPDDEYQAEIASLLMSSYGASYDSSKTYYYTQDADGNYYFICGDDVESASGSQGTAAQITVRSADDTVYYTNGTYYLTADELANIDIDDDTANTLSFHSATNDPIYTNFTAVGNCDLTEISVDDYADDDTISTALQQILTDMKSSSSTAYANLSACFDSDTGEYLGGIYSFTLYGVTYYTTEADLTAAVASAYEDDCTSSNGIDGQDNLSYYSASYISTTIEITSKALLETDGSGRFSTVKFENDSVVYSLTCETVTDDDAYNDAMNQYYYDMDVYDKGVSDINAKTEIIQAEDRELELRLEQLDTEQSALQTEMEACQKVVSKAVENGFGAFGG